jgi:transposase InsO family protein
MPKPDAATAARNLAIAFEHYNEKHPHSALKYRLATRVSTQDRFINLV